MKKKYIQILLILLTSVLISVGCSGVMVQRITTAEGTTIITTNDDGTTTVQKISSGGLSTGQSTGYPGPYIPGSSGTLIEKRVYLTPGQFAQHQVQFNPTGLVELYVPAGCQFLIYAKKGGDWPTAANFNIIYNLAGMASSGAPAQLIVDPGLWYFTIQSQTGSGEYYLVARAYSSGDSPALMMDENEDQVLMDLPPDEPVMEEPGEEENGGLIGEVVIPDDEPLIDEAIEPDEDIIVHDEDVPDEHSQVADEEPIVPIVSDDEDDSDEHSQVVEDEPIVPIVSDDEDEVPVDQPVIEEPGSVTPVSCIENQVFVLTNMEYTSGDYVRDPALDAIARAYSAALCSRDQNRADSATFSHFMDGNGPGERLTEAGYQWRSFAENIYHNGCGGGSCEDIASRAIERWMGSSGHRRNIMNENANQNTNIGVGVASCGDGCYYITQLFTTPAS